MKGSTTLVLALTALLAGCASNDIQTNSTKLVSASDLAGRQSWAWASDRGLNLRDPNRNTSAAQGWIESAVSAELASRGYTATGAGTADMLVGFRAGSRTNLNSREYSAHDELSGAGLDEAGGTSAAISPSRTFETGVERGRLVLTVSDRKSGKLLYTGSAETDLRNQQNESRAVPRINRAVSSILKDFPRQGATAGTQ